MTVRKGAAEITQVMSQTLGERKLEIEGGRREREAGDRDRDRGLHRGESRGLCMLFVCVY